MPATTLLDIPWLWRLEGVAQVNVGPRVLTLPVQTVDSEDVEALALPWKPNVPIVRVRVPVAVLGQEARRIIASVEPDDLAEQLLEYNQLCDNMYLLCGLGADLVDDQGQVVWSPAHRGASVESALAVLKQTGLTHHTPLLLKAIGELTAASPINAPEAPGEPLPSYTPPGACWPAQFHGKIDPTPNAYSYYYTTSHRLKQILSSGALEPHTTGTKHEKPIVWFSRNQIFEPGRIASSVVRQSDNSVGLLSFEAMVGAHTRLVRIGVCPGLAPLNQRALQDQAGWKSLTKKYDARVATAMAADTRLWRGTLNSVRCTSFACVDIWCRPSWRWRRVWLAKLGQTETAVALGEA